MSAHFQFRSLHTVRNSRGNISSKSNNSWTMPAKGTKLIFSYYAKNEDAASALELKKTLIQYDRSLLVADPRRMEPKKFGGRGARARRQKASTFKLQRENLAHLSPTDRSTSGSSHLLTALGHAVVSFAFRSHIGMHGCIGQLV